MKIIYEGIELDVQENGIFAGEIDVSPLMSLETINEIEALADKELQEEMEEDAYEEAAWYAELNRGYAHDRM